MLFRTFTILAFAAAVSAVPIAGSGGDYPVFDPSLSTSMPTTLPTDFASAPVAPLTPTMARAEMVSPGLDSTGSTSSSDFPDISMFGSPTPTTSPTNVEPVTGGLLGAPQGTENATEDDLNQLFDKLTAPPAGGVMGDKVPPTVEAPCGSTTVPTPVLPSPTSVPTAGVPTPEQAIEEPTGLPPLGDFNLPSLDQPTSSPVLPTGEANAAPTPCATPTGVPTSPVGLLPPGKCNTSADCKGAGECCSEFGNCGTSPEYCSRSKMGIPFANAVTSPSVAPVPTPSPSPSPCPSPTPAPTPAPPAPISVAPPFDDVTGNQPPLPAFPTPSVSVPPIGFAEQPPTSNPPTPTPPCSCANNPTSPGTTLSNPPIPVSPATETPNPITSFSSSPFSGLPDAPTPTGSPSNEDSFGTNTPVLPAVTPGSPTPTATATPCDKNNLPAELNATTPASIDDLTGNSPGAMVAAGGGAGLTGSSMGSSGGKAMTYKPAY